METIYYGVVKGRTVILPSAAELDDGTVVEIHRVASGNSDDEVVKADLAMQRALVAAGLAREIKPLGARSAEPDPSPIRVQGRPLSETIIAERR